MLTPAWFLSDGSQSRFRLTERLYPIKYTKTEILFGISGRFYIRSPFGRCCYMSSPFGRCSYIWKPLRALLLYGKPCRFHPWKWIVEERVKEVYRVDRQRRDQRESWRADAFSGSDLSVPQCIQRGRLAVRSEEAVSAGNSFISFCSMREEFLLRKRASFRSREIL